jgi:diguanylate cyclase (GGDEF)-like protein/PAS domain S-box-containing protein
MFSLLNRLSVRSRVWMIVALFIGAIVCGSVVDILTLRHTLWQEKELKTRHLVESAYGVLDHYHRLQQNGELDEAVAQAAAIGTLRAMRYDDKEYFWVNDLEIPIPRMVMHPTIPALDGSLLDADQFRAATGWRIGNEGDFVALDGRENLFAKFVEVSAQTGDGYVTYDWPKPKQGGRVSSETYPKLSYVKRFEPWGWLIGSGVYMDDVGKSVDSLVLRNGLLATAGGGILLLLASAIASSITGPLRRTVQTMGKVGLADGNLSLRLPVDGRSEFTQLSKGFNEMLDHLQARDAELAHHRERLEELVEQRSGQLRAANLALEKELAKHKLAEQKVRESRAQMRALLDATRESVLLLDPDGLILEINAFGAQRFGTVPEALIGQNFFALIPPDLAETRRAVVTHVINTGEPIHSEDRRGSIYFHNSLYPVKDESGAVACVAVYAKDVSEQHRAKGIDDVFRHLDSVLLKWRMNLESIAQIFCDGILPVFDLSAAWIARAEKDGRLTMLAGTGDGADFVGRLRESEIRWDGDPSAGLPLEAVIRHGYRRVVRFSDGVAGFPESSTLVHGATAALLLPLSLRGERWGVLALYGSEPAQFDGQEVPVRLGAIAGRLGASLESAQQQEWLTLLDAALAGVGNSVFITDADGTILWVNRSFVELSGYEARQLLGKNPRILSAGVHGVDFYRRFWETVQAGNTWRGDIINARPDGSRYTVSQTITPLLDTAGEVSHFVAILEDISERKAAEERMRYAASFDRLTDLPNRGLFMDRLNQSLALARREGTRGALLFLDLDHFKQVNDELGHAAGDELLIAVARRLREVVREGDTVARLGGDEFTLILNRIREPANAAAIAGKILAALVRPLVIAGRELRVGVSIGIAVFPDHGEKIEALLEAADHAMYRAKKAGRQGYAFVESDPVPCMDIVA